jgi:hypothetical protein
MLPRISFLVSLINTLVHLDIISLFVCRIASGRRLANRRIASSTDPNSKSKCPVLDTLGLDSLGLPLLAILK